MGLIRRRSAPRSGRAQDDATRVFDPGAAFHVGHERQLRALQQLRTSSAQLAASAKRLEVQALDLRTRRSRFEDQARRALTGAHEEEALECLTKAHALLSQIEDLDARVEQLGQLRGRLDASGRRLEATVASMRTEADAAQALSLPQYGNARTVTRPAPGPRPEAADAETLGDLGPDAGELDLLVQQARDKTLWAQARAEAVGELIERGDPVPVEPDMATDPRAQEQIRRRLAELRAELAGPGGEDSERPSGRGDGT